MTHVVWSTWCPTPPRIGSGIIDGDWSGAASLPLPGNPAGALLIHNDARFVYLGLDLPEGTDPALDPGDLFWFSVDADQDGAITPGVDLNYAQAMGEPNRLVRQHYMGPNSWTGALPDPTDSMCGRGFGPSGPAPFPHANWTARIDLGEMGVAPGDAILFGLRVRSASPPFTYDLPEGFIYDFSALAKLHLAARPVIPADLAGDVIAGVGLIPATTIVDGYATTDPGYFVPVVEAAFAGVLNLIGNGTTLARLWAAGARRYTIQHQFAGTGFTPIDQTWSNYRLNGRRHELRPFGPDGAHTYPLADPNDEYSIDDLLLQWNSTDAPAGVHDFFAQFFAADGSPVATGADHTLRLMVDNGRPVVRIDEITRPIDEPPGRARVLACDFVRLARAGEGRVAQGIEIAVTAAEPRWGHLLDWSLAAEYGDGIQLPLASQSYHPPPPPDRRWVGVTRHVVGFVPPATCAYLFRLGARMRVTNGYTPYVGGADTFKSLTLVLA